MRARRTCCGWEPRCATLAGSGALAGRLGRCCCAGARCAWLSWRLWQADGSFPAKHIHKSHQPPPPPSSAPTACSFWGQLVLTVVSTTILLFSTGVPSSTGVQVRDLLLPACLPGAAVACQQVQ